VDLEEPDDPSDSIIGHRVGVREIEAVLPTGIGDLVPREIGSGFEASAEWWPIVAAAMRERQSD
jgi:hypothetical protein